MKFLIQLILIILLTAIAEIFLPWWSLMLVCFLVCCFIFGSRGSAFLSGFVGVGLLWFAYSRYIDLSTDSILTRKVAGVFGLPSLILNIPNTIVLILVTSLIGALAGGLGALSGHLLREIFKKKKKLYY